MAERPPPPIPPAPEGAGLAGRDLWRSVLSAYELAGHEVVLLGEAVRVADACADLQAVLDAEGLIVAGKVHPASIELRQQRLLLGRLLVALRLPEDDEDEPKRTQRRGLRGPYGPRGLTPVREAG